MCTGTHPFIPVANTARVRMVYTQYGQELMNVFHFTKSGSWSPADLTTLAASVATEWNANVKALQTNQIRLELVEATDLSVAGGAQVTHAVGTVGGNVAAGDSTSVTIALKFATGLSGRSHRGRMYFCGTPLGQAVSNDYLPAFVAGIVAAYIAFFGNIETTTSSTHSVVSYCQSNAWLTAGATTPVISILATDNHVDSQRRRLTGRGV